MTDQRKCAKCGQCHAPRGYLYQRVSTTQQDTARQHAANRQAAAALGLDAREYNDDGIGASSKSHGKQAGANRPGYRAMVDDISTACPGDYLITHDVSRTDRQLETWAPLLAACRRVMVLVHVTEDHETYDPRKANHWRTLAMAGVQAEADSLGKSDMIRSGQQYWKSMGHPMSRPTYGIKRINDPDKIRNRWLRNIPDPVTSPIVARIMADIGAGVSYSEIARRLNADGIPTPRAGRCWHSSVVTKLALHAGAYAEVGIITEDEAMAARARLAATAGMGRGSGAKAQSHRYTGVITCHRCQGMLAGSPHSNGTVRYRCKQGCTSVLASEVDTYVDAWCVARLSRPDAVTLISDPATQGAAADARAEAAALQAKLQAWLDDPDITPVEYRTVKARLQPQITAALQRAQQASAVPALAGLADTDQAIVKARWASLTTQARKTAVMAMAPTATMGPGRRGVVTSVADRLTMV